MIECLRHGTCQAVGQSAQRLSLNPHDRFSGELHWKDDVSKNGRTPLNMAWLGPENLRRDQK
jgi:hypothetical protein